MNDQVKVDRSRLREIQYRLDAFGDESLCVGCHNMQGQPCDTDCWFDALLKQPVNSARISVDDAENADVSIYLTGEWADELEKYGGRRDGDGLLLCLVRGNSIFIEEGMGKDCT